MRDKVTKILVDQNVYESVSTQGCAKVKYLSADGLDSGLDKMDFIIFCNSNDEKVLRLFWELNENSIEYTSAFLHNGNNISLVAICVVLYDSIMWLRHCTYIGDEIKSMFVKFPKEQSLHNIEIIECCLELLGDSISIELFIEKIKRLEDETFKYKSLVAVLREFGWENKVVRKGLLDNIEIEIEYMRNSLNDKKALCKIWKSAYKIHNEPEKILCSVNDIVG